MKIRTNERPTSSETCSVSAGATTIHNSPVKAGAADSSHRPCPPNLNLAGYVLRNCARLADKPALELVGPHSSDIWRYDELEDQVLRLSQGMIGLGLAPGDRVLLRLGNSVEFPLAYLAAIAGGLVPVPTSAQLTSDEITRLSQIVRPSLILSGDGIALPKDPACPVLNTQDMAQLASGARGAFAATQSDAPAYIVFTSGTSGTPRAVVHAHRAIWARRCMYDGWYGLRETDRVMHAGAFNWTYTLGTGLMDPWSLGATALIPRDGTASTALPDYIAKTATTVFAAAPGVYRQMLRTGFPDTPALRHGLSAGEKLPETIRSRWQQTTGTDIHEAFGMSECSTFLSGSPTRPAPANSLGFAQSGRKITLLDPASKTPVGPKTPGIIAIDACEAGLMRGYLEAPEETAARYTDDGQWFLTGDLAQMSDAGAFQYLGRDDDMMNAGGYRVSPLEVEAAIAAHPDIQEVAATDVAIKSDTKVIAVFFSAHKVLKQQDLSAFASQRLARYKTPKIFIQMDALPRGANGKLSRKALRKSFEATHGQT